jgi:hypothetical protein
MKQYGVSSIQKNGSIILSHPQVQVALYAFKMSMHANFQRYLDQEKIPYDYDKLLFGLLKPDVVNKMIKIAVHWAQTKGPLATYSGGDSANVWGL